MSSTLTYDEVVNRKITQGIYFSNVTGRIFEATEKRGKTVIKYVDGTEMRTFENNVFKIQLQWLDFYELLIPYEDEK